jgi:hypothetical protein
MQFILGQHVFPGNPTDDYEVFDSNRRVVGRIMRHPQAPEGQTVVLDDNRAGATALSL